MRYEKGHKEETRRKVIETASRRFRRDGIEATGVASLMADAGLTHGGFYAHFTSKDDLVIETVGAALTRSRRLFEEPTTNQPPFVEFLDYYLSPAHRDHPERGCLAAALTPEIARLSARARTRFTEALEGLLSLIAHSLHPSIKGKARLNRARSIFSLVMGALQLARAVNDAELSAGFLADARKAALRLGGFEE